MVKYSLEDILKSARNWAGVKHSASVRAILPAFEQRKALGAEAMKKIMGTKRPNNIFNPPQQPQQNTQPAVKSARCWKGYEPVPGKAPYSEDSCRPVGSGKKKKEHKKSEKKAGTPAWQRSEGKNEAGGLNEKGRKSYEREHGGNLQAPVTEKNPTGKAKARRHSFCSRMCGMKRVNTGASTAKDPDSRINKSLRKWNCKCSSAELFGQKLAEMLTPGAPTKPAQQPRLMSQIVGQLVDKVIPVNRTVTSPSRGKLLAQTPVQAPQSQQIATAK